MPVQPILEYPDPQLALPSRPVTVFGDELKALVADLRDTLYATSGIGLCAPQIGHQLGVLVMDLTPDHSDLQVFINPVVEHSDVPGIVEESCLSVPGLKVKVVRATEVDVRAVDTDGESFTTHLSGMHAVCLQHEMDHLGGRLLTDRMSWLRRLLLRATGRMPGQARAA